MKKVLSAILAGAALAVTAGSVSAAAILDLKMTATETAPGSGLYNIVVSGKATGSSTGQGDGGISDAQFAITSLGSGNANVIAAGTGPLAGKSKITWDSAVTGGFSVVNPSKTDVGADGDADFNGAAFFDSNNFTKTDLGTSDYQTLFTTQFQLVPGHQETLHLTASNVQYYDFTNGTAPNFRGTFSAITSNDVVIPVPEPASLGLLGLGVLGLAARRRNA